MILLEIRFHQLKRALAELKLYILIPLAILSLIVLISNSLHKNQFTSGYQLFFLLSVCLVTHLTRKDKDFIYLHVKNPIFEIFSEYFLASLPFSFSVLLFPHWYHAFIFLVLLAFIPFIKSGISVRQPHFKLISKIIGSKRFEYISGLRQSFYFLIPIYLLALFLSWVPILPLVLLWLITVSFTSFYYECEPLGILRSSGQSPRTFLWRKIVLHSKFLLALLAPVLIINAFCNPGYWYINLIFFILQLLLLVFAITLKYSCYRPNANLNQNNIILSLVSLGAVLPYFLPIPLFMISLYFNKAIKNLNHFL